MPESNSMSLTLSVDGSSFLTGNSCLTFPSPPCLCFSCLRHCSLKHLRSGSRAFRLPLFSVLTLRFFLLDEFFVTQNRTLETIVSLPFSIFLHLGCVMLASRRRCSSSPLLHSLLFIISFFFF